MNSCPIRTMSQRKLPSGILDSTVCGPISQFSASDPVEKYDDIGDISFGFGFELCCFQMGTFAEQTTCAADTAALEHQNATRGEGKRIQQITALVRVQEKGCTSGASEVQCGLVQSDLLRSLKLSYQTASFELLPGRQFNFQAPLSACCTLCGLRKQHVEAVSLQAASCSCILL